MHKKYLSILVLPLLCSITGCNRVKLAIKSKGEEVKPLLFADEFMKAYESNLIDFNDKWFIGYNKAEDLKTSFTVSFRQSTQRKIITRSITTGISKTTDVNITSDAKFIYDEDGIYSIKSDTLETTSDQNKVSYSNETEDCQYQIDEETVHYFDKKDETYYTIPGISDVKKFAMNNERALSVYNTLSGVYAYIALAGDTFGEGEDYINNQYYIKGNVFTVVNTTDFAATILDKSNYAEIQGSIEQTRQYIIEKKYITYTKYIEYKKVTWKDSDNEYVYSMEYEDGVTYDLRMKGYATTLATKNYTEIDYPEMN